MDINYHKWLELKITNSYFEGGVCPVLKIVPFNETARALTNYNILLRKTDNSISFYCGTPAVNFNATTELAGLNELYFQVLIDDPLFLNYTEITSVTFPKLFLFQNSKSSLLLQKQKYVSSEDVITPAQNSLPNITIPADATIEIKNLQGDTIQKQTNNPEDFVPININNLETGIFQLWINEIFKENFEHFNTSIAENCLGILKLDLDLGLNTAAHPAPLTLDFKVRDAYWQYQIVTPDSWDKKKTTIEIEGAQGETYPIPSPKLTKKIGEKTAEVLTSNKAIPLVQKLPTHPLMNISYTNAFSNMENKLEIKLPNPSAKNLKIITNEQGDSSFCYTTIVYV